MLEGLIPKAIPCVNNFTTHNNNQVFNCKCLLNGIAELSSVLIKKYPCATNCTFELREGWLNNSDHAIYIQNFKYQSKSVFHKNLQQNIFGIKLNKDLIYGEFIQKFSFFQPMSEIGGWEGTMYTATPNSMPYPPPHIMDT